MTQTAVIDQATFDELAATAGAEFVVELVETFFEEAPSILAEVRAAAEVQDAVRLKRAAHSLKSNAHTFGATALGAAARAVEWGGLPAADAAALAQLQSEYDRAAAALKDLCRG